MPLKSALRYLIASQVVFFGLLAICIDWAPQSLTNNRGMSYFGYHWPALIPFMGALLMGPYCLSQAATRLRDMGPPLPSVAQALKAIAILTPLVLLTPSDDLGLVHDLHVTVSAIVFMVEFGLSTTLLLACIGNWLERLAWSLQLLAGLVALLSLWGILRVMLPSELVLQLMFSLVLNRTLPKIEGARLRLPPAEPVLVRKTDGHG